MLFFGIAGAVLFVIGFLAGVVALVLRFGYGIGFRPLLNLVETMVISGIVLFGFGFVGEMIAGMQEETREMARALARLDKSISGTSVRVVFLTHNYPRFAGDRLGRLPRHPRGRAGAPRRRGAGGGAERRGQGGEDELDGVPVRRVRYAAPGAGDARLRRHDAVGAARPGRADGRSPGSGGRCAAPRGKSWTAGRRPGARPLVGPGRTRRAAAAARWC